ncbi:MAG: deaminase [Candidimonas sp.]
MINDWDCLFMSMAYLVSMKSEDPSTKIGAVIVDPSKCLRGVGYNGLPRKLPHDCSYNVRPLKYDYYEHAERNAIYNCGRIGVPVIGCVMYTQGMPCSDCCRGIIQSGISEVVIHQKWQSMPGWEKWAESQKVAENMFSETGVKLRFYDGPIVTDIIGMRGDVSFCPDHNLEKND